MHRVNNVVIMQTKQFGRIKALEEELQSSRAKMVELEQKVSEQDRVIAQLVGDNLKHLQDNMQLTTHINSSQEQMAQMEHWLESLMEEERESGTSSSSDSEGSAASGSNSDALAGGEVNVDAGMSMEGRRDSLIPQEGGLIVEMEREAMEAGLGGWFNGNPEDVPESWSGANSDASASQDQVGVTLLTTIGGRTLPNPVRVPDNCHCYDFLVCVLEWT